MNIAGDYGTYSTDDLRAACTEKGIRNGGSRKTLMKYLQHPELAKLVRLESDPATWTTLELQTALKAAGMKPSGSRRDLISRVKNTNSAPAGSELNDGIVCAWTLARLRVELIAMNLPSSGNRAAMVSRIVKANKENLSAEALLRGSEVRSFLSPSVKEGKRSKKARAGQKMTKVASSTSTISSNAPNEGTRRSQRRVSKRSRLVEESLSDSGSSADD